MSRFRNKRLYTDVFPEFRQGLIGTEYEPIEPPSPPQAIKEKFGEAPKPKKQIPITERSREQAKTVETQTMTTAIVPSIYDTEKQEDIPKSQLDLPLQIALEANYP
jgi:hypothetical protein